MSELNKFMPPKKRKGKWIIAWITSIAGLISAVVIALQCSWPYIVKGIRPWAETPDKVDALNTKMDMVMERLGMNNPPKSPENPYLPPKLKSVMSDPFPTNTPSMAQGSIETTNRTKL